jgi:hypothetical protein
VLRFPWWSEGQGVEVRFRPTPGSEDSHFLLQYRAVPKAECQGHNVPRTATTDVQHIMCKGLPVNDTSGNIDCHWVLKANETSRT